MIMTQFNLAHAYATQERWADSQCILLELMENQRKIVPHEHPDMIEAELELARITKQLGQLDEAETLLKRNVSMAEKVHGPHDSRTLNAMGQLAAIYIARGQPEEADNIEARFR